MPVRILLAEDASIMSKALVQHLAEEPALVIVGVASNFAELMQMRADHKPDILLMDLHLPEKRDFTPAFVKSQLASIPVIAISFSVDDEACELAASYGAVALLDKTTLHGSLIPTLFKVALKEHVTDGDCAPKLALSQRAS